MSMLKGFGKGKKEPNIVSEPISAEFRQTLVDNISLHLTKLNDKDWIARQTYSLILETMSSQGLPVDPETVVTSRSGGGGGGGSLDRPPTSSLAPSSRFGASGPTSAPSSFAHTSASLPQAPARDQFNQGATGLKQAAGAYGSYQQGGLNRENVGQAASAFKNVNAASGGAVGRAAAAQVGAAAPPPLPSRGPEPAPAPAPAYRRANTVSQAPVAPAPVAAPAPAPRPPAAARPPQRQMVVATADFAAVEDGDLGFRAGDLIAIVDDVDDNWYRGELRGKRGIFPKNFVQAR
ncbi:hypothetical protein BDK51DRAFT_46538 [Blyttiomyces helicus]|uniref:SH3 domain-containing protein n=1 Tax=Blyttiomyces helicus TaxID=388810 RepID=A0A4P9W8Q7_9FUNG|nr:hypothetical protein BDK51DRAFT_46538 [Blyttiomyces helicus]|eukprot:RKO87468.1 hypothetical protein BDK51DRAFT_46538 [Blyttiomyces helicus]